MKVVMQRRVGWCFLPTVIMMMAMWKSYCDGFLWTGHPQQYPSMMQRQQQQQQQQQQQHHPLYQSSNNNSNNNNSHNNHNQKKMIKDKEEPLSLLFQRAVMLQRAGEYHSSLQEYETFVKAATQLQVDSSMYAEVLCNMGSIYVKLGATATATATAADPHTQEYYDTKAQDYYELALETQSQDTRTTTMPPPLQIAHVNLALLSLKQGSQTMDPQKGYACLQKAQYHCQQVVGIEGKEKQEVVPDEHTNGQPIQMAKKLLTDINRMLEQMR